MIHAIRAFIVCLCLVLLCSCAISKPDANNAPGLKLPANVTFNKEAGAGDWLYLKLRLENGEELLFFLDTGCPKTILDKSLQSKLGKRLGTSKSKYSWFGKAAQDVYEAPKLYLGDTQLLVGKHILTDDLSKMSTSRPIMGILGMDCLRHYCIQLDFSAGEMRFLDPNRLKTESLGKTFPLTINTGNVLTRADFFGQSNVWFNVDTGCTIDGTLKPELFQQEIRKHLEIQIQQTKTPAGLVVNIADFQKVDFGHETFHNFILSDCPYSNFLGLRFLARHLVTLNFPKGTMYLRPRTDELIVIGVNATNMVVP